MALVYGVYRAVDEAGVDEGTHRVVDQHHIRRVVAQRAQRQARRSCRVAPPWIAVILSSFETGDGRPEQLVVVGVYGDDYPPDPRDAPRKAWIVWAMTGSPADRAVLLRAVGLAGPLAASGGDDDDCDAFAGSAASDPSCMAETHSRDRSRENQWIPE